MPHAEVASLPHPRYRPPQRGSHAGGAARPVLAAAAIALLLPGAGITAHAQIILPAAERPAAGAFFDRPDPVSIAVEMDAASAGKDTRR